MRKTEVVVEQKIVTLIALGYKYADISQKTGVPVPTIKKIKKRSQVRLGKIEERVIEKHVDEVSQMLKKSYSLINRLLDKEDAGLIEISIKDLLQISNEMSRQASISAPQAPRRQKLRSVYEKYL